MPASRSLIALLVGTVVFFAVWLVALKPSSKSGSGTSSSQGLGAYQSDINKAHQAVGISNASNAASGNENATSSSGGAAASSTPSTAQQSTTASTGSTSPKPSTKSSAKPTSNPSASTTKAQQRALAHNVSAVQAAISAHKVLALLFYNPAAADDQAVKQELASVPTHKRHVVKLAIPLSEAGAFTAVTQQVPVNLSPTLVLVSTGGQASEIVGFSTAFEISQRVDDAFAVN